MIIHRQKENIKTNKERIQRHMARSTPDKITAQFDYMSADYMMKTNEWMQRFAKRMRIKHNAANIELQVYVNENMIDPRTSQVIIVVSVNTKRRNDNGRKYL